MKLNELHSLLQKSMLTLDPIIKPYLCPPPRGSIDERVAIYAEGFYGRLEETLANDYSTLAEMLGESKFNTLCRKYIDAYPSYHYSLNSFGQHLSQFLLETVAYSKKTYLSEIAAFEWAESDAIISRNAELLSESDLRDLPPKAWPKLKLYLHPSCQILCMHWNSLALIEAPRRGLSIPHPRKLKSPQFVLVWRRQLEVRYCKLDHLEQNLLQAIKSQATFMEICEQLSHKMPEAEVATYIVKKLHSWLNEQIFVQNQH
ncbi:MULTISPECIES: DNA-binding domain-containing protein [Legionella]|uniref:Uncharacterized protein n=1 Tax=Legionella drozanskii LLAP-1 TaxID=1212489 RepID=A0A0W0TC05_9GAMM|nr:MULTISPECIES: DNA-binding domain-containing protein [Legionella]KTC93127.1 hypothetical protein Ldro_0498 [Legionella drozanskii LLAP-1]PJE09370.1 MAG: DUF2063 domain-containing protein [Legionella sp.]